LRVEAALAKLSADAIDLMILGRLQRPADAPALLRAVRAGEHPRIHPHSRPSPWEPTTS
jgi:hypothetical protein